VPPDLLQRGLEHLKASPPARTAISDRRGSRLRAHLLTRNGIVMTNEIISLRTELDGKYAVYYRRLDRGLSRGGLPAAETFGRAEKLLDGLRLGDRRSPLRLSL